jgi:hypothetical protein
MKLSFDTNIPHEVCLMTLDGEAVESQYGGPQRRYTTTDRDTFYVSDTVGNIIAETCRKLKIEEREPVVICKAEVPDGRGRKAIRWQVTRVNAPVPQVGPQPDGGFAAQRAPTANTNGANGSHPPAPPVAPTTQVQQPVPVINGNGTANGDNGYAPAPKTKLEDALKTVVAAAYAAELYAKQVGYTSMPPFSSEDIRTMANTLMIQNGNGGAR